MPATVPVIRFDTLDSTNAEARRRHEDGEAGPQWFVCGEQTAGKGRLGRDWISPKGNVYCSLLLPWSATPALLPQVSFVAACAVHDTVMKFAGNRGKQVLLKWPNDCLLDGAKVAGVLCEGLGDAAVIGCGINVASAPQGLSYPATCLAAAGARCDADEVFGVLARALARRLERWDNGAGFPQISKDWQAHAIGIGEPVEVDTGNGTLEGVFEGIGPSGEALLRKRKQTVSVWSGDFNIPALRDLRKRSA